jgi:DNA-binding NarL/FixJ family response regulator
MADRCTVVIVEDDPRIREAVRQLIDSDADFRCLGTYGSAEHALRGLETAPADLVLLDIQLPGMQGSDAVGILHQRFPQSRIVMFTVFDDDQRVFTSLCNGASGYILKKTASAKLLDALRDARDGGAPISPEIARRVVDLFRALRPEPAPAQSLTASEKKLLALLAEGHSYQSAGEALQISVNTVRNHVRSIYEKLHVHSKSAAVSKALRSRLI